jgi:dTDP-3-amino-3,4,6-trideoxy-alpha-D-glucose transaminase
MINVPFMDLARHHAPVADELRAAFDRVLGSSAFILGAEVERFEQAFADYCGTAHCVGVNSGTAALSIMLEAAGIGPGDEVIVPAHTFAASALAVVHAGATAVPADVDAETGLLDVEAARAAIGPRTAALLPVHLYGQLCPMDELRELAQRHGLAVFEDAAQAHGAGEPGRRAGALGTAGAFSFYPSKNLGALGDGGAICTDDGALADKARALRDLGRRGAVHEYRGYNERLDGVQAALLAVKLPHLDGYNARRRAHASAYAERLNGVVELLGERSDGSCVYHLMPVRVADRDGLGAALAARGIASGVHYPVAIPDHPALSELSGHDTPVARAWAATELSLPIFPELAADELDAVCHAVLATAAPAARTGA